MQAEPVRCIICSIAQAFVQYRQPCVVWAKAFTCYSSFGGMPIVSANTTGQNTRMSWSTIYIMPILSFSGVYIIQGKCVLLLNMHARVRSGVMPGEFKVRPNNAARARLPEIGHFQASSQSSIQDCDPRRIDSRRSSCEAVHHHRSHSFPYTSPLPWPVSSTLRVCPPVWQAATPTAMSRAEVSCSQRPLATTR